MTVIRGIVSAITDGAVRLFAATGLSGQSFTKREFIQAYGLATHPKPGAELVIIVQGNVITAIGSDDRRYRLALAEGEAALYDDLGQKVHLTRTGIEAYSPTKITATAPEVDVIASTKVAITSPLVSVTGNITAGGNITATGNVYDAGGAKSMLGMRTVYNSHVHGLSVTPTGAM